MEVDERPTTALSTVAVTPDGGTFSPSDSLRFSLNRTGESSQAIGLEDVAWQATGGTITRQGLYVAGSTPGRFQVIARRATGEADTASVVITTEVLAEETLAGMAPEEQVLGTTYYVDATQGSDLNTGLSPSAAWKTIARVNSSPFLPGDKILFEKGEVWHEQLNITSSGTPGARITFGAYGTGSRPRIDGDGHRASCITGQFKDNIWISSFECTGWINSGVSDFGGSGWIIQGSKFFSGGNDSPPDHAIRVYAPEGSPLLTGIQIRNNTIRTVNTVANELIGSTGITLAGVDGAIVRGNDIKTPNTIGLRIVHNTGSVDNKNPVVEDNDFHGCYGNIVVANTDGIIIRRNILRDGASPGIGLAWDSDNAEISENRIINLPTKTETIWNGIDINRGSQNGRVHHNTIAGVYNNAVVIAASDGWSVDHNILDITNNVDLPLAIKIFEGTAWTSDFNTFWNGSSVAPGSRARNGSFETFTGTADDGNTDGFTGWTKELGTGGRIEAVTVRDLSAAPIPKGQYALKMVPASSGVETIRQRFRLKPKRVYKLSFYARSAGGAVGRLGVNHDVRVWLQDDGSWVPTAKYDVVQISASDSQWTKKVLKFTSHNATTYEIRIENLFNEGNLYLDGFVLKELGPAIGEHKARVGFLAGGMALDFFDWKARTGQDLNSSFAP